jgi:SPP1 family phage portal protein
MHNGSDRVVIAFEYYIVEMMKGYLSGKAPKYSVRESDVSEAYQEAIDEIRRYNDDAATFTELIHDYLITSAAYLYVYENAENEIVYACLDSKRTICIYDYGTPPYPIALIQHWTEKDENNTEIRKIEVITDKHRRIYDENGGLYSFADYNGDGVRTEMTEKVLYWNDVPAAAFENPDGIAIFESAIGLIDTYENMMTNVKNMTQYNDNAKLKITGFTLENKDRYLNVYDSDGDMELDNNGNPVKVLNQARVREEKDLYESPTLFLPPNDGDVSWLIKDVDYSGVLSVLKQIHDMITMLTGVPNMTDEAFANADNASALGYKLYALNQYSAAVDRIFKKGYLRLWEIITNRLNFKNNSAYKFRDIDIIFSRNVPTDTDKSINRAVTAKNAGLVSLETAINISDIDVDSASEIMRIKAEEDAEMQRIQRNQSINDDSGGEEDDGSDI